MALILMKSKPFEVAGTSTKVCNQAKNNRGVVFTVLPSLDLKTSQLYLTTGPDSQLNGQPLASNVSRARTSHLAAYPILS